MRAVLLLLALVVTVQASEICSELYMTHDSSIKIKKYGLPSCVGGFGGGSRYFTDKTKA